MATCLACICGAGLALISRWNNPTRRVGALQNLVRQNVKVGDSPDKVIRFLDAQHLERSELMKPEVMNVNRHDYGNQNVIVAIKRHTGSPFSWDESISLVFAFNDQRELVRFELIRGMSRVLLSSMNRICSSPRKRSVNC